MRAVCGDQVHRLVDLGVRGHITATIGGVLKGKRSQRGERNSAAIGYHTNTEERNRKLQREKVERDYGHWL